MRTSLAIFGLLHSSRWSVVLRSVQCGHVESPCAARARLDPVGSHPWINLESIVCSDIVCTLKALEKAAQLTSVYSNEILCFALKKCIKNIMSKHLGILLIYICVMVWNKIMST